MRVHVWTNGSCNCGIVPANDFYLMDDIFVISFNRILFGDEGGMRCSMMAMSSVSPLWPDASMESG